MAKTKVPTGRTLWRLELHGPRLKGQWFIPSGEAGFVDGTPKAVIKAHLLKLVHSYYPAQPGDRVVLSKIAERVRSPASGSESPVKAGKGKAHA